MGGDGFALGGFDDGFAVGHDVKFAVAEGNVAQFFSGGFVGAAEFDFVVPDLGVKELLDADVGHQ